MNKLTYEPFDPKYRENAPAYYKQLREHAPVYRTEQGYWIISRYDDIRAAQRAPDVFSSALVGKELLGVGGDIDPSIPLAEIGFGMPVDLRELMDAPVLVGVDDPKHAELRRIINRGFLPKRVAQWDEQIHAYTRECLQGVDRNTAWDVVSTLAVPLPVWTFSGILGVGNDDRDNLKDWSTIAIQVAHGDDRGSKDATIRMLKMMRDFSCFFGPLIEARRTAPGDDLISDLVRAEEEETLSAVETLMFTLLLMVAGTETTTNLIGNTVVCLLENPDQLKILCDDPSLIPSAIDESLRYRSPAQLTIRSPSKDVEVGGCLIRAGEPICLMNASGNRDPNRFPDPDRFDVTRNPKDHLAFGHGIHLCVGAHLARREAAIALGALLPDLQYWRLDDAPLERLENNAVYGFKEIRLRPL